jgi:dienelactone hydrolase
MPCGHTAIAKAGATYQRAAISMAKAGIAAFCYDPIGQGERRFFLKPDGTPEFPSSTDEHQLLGVGATLLGSNLARDMIWDGMRALDYLQSRPDIWSGRLGCTGVSGGGTMTSYLMALDDRIVAAAPACYLTGFRRLLETLGPQDAEQNLHGQIAAGLDHADYVLMAAPRPVLVMAATHDFFDIRGTWDVFRQAQRFYTRLGVPERVAIVEADRPHSLEIEMREASARWFRRWLLGKDDAWQEPPFDILPEKEVLCTPDGNVFHLPGARTYFDLQKERAAKLDGQRWHASRPPAEVLAKVRELAHIRPLAEIPKLTATEVNDPRAREGSPQRLLLRNNEGTVLPASLVRSREPGGTVYLEIRSRSPRNFPEIQPMKPGDSFLSVDVRGAGSMEKSSARNSYDGISGPDWPWVAEADMLGESFVGLRTEDILACARYASETWNAGQPIVLLGIGETGVPALHAAALEPQLFTFIHIKQSLPSWADVVGNPRARNQQINTVFGALHYYDLPELAALIPAGKLQISDPADAATHVKPKRLGGTLIDWGDSAAPSMREHAPPLPPSAPPR